MSASSPRWTQRDLSGGGLFLSATALCSFLLSLALPMWWMTTTELEGRMCTCGTGLFQANVTWGDDLTEPNMLEPFVCVGDNARVTQRCDGPWENQDESRNKGKLAGAFVVLACVFALAAVVCGWRHVPGYGDPKFARYAFWFSSLAFCAQVVAMAVFTNSPVFENLDYYFGCHFVFVNPTKSNELICHALGPGWAVSAMGTIFCGVAAVMSYFAYHPTEYTHPSTGRYSLFTENFERHDEEMRLRATVTASATTTAATSPIMAEDEEAPPLDTASLPRRVMRAYGIPLLCLGNIMLFLYSNMSTGATVEPRIRIKFPHWLAIIINPIIPLTHGDTLAFVDDVFNFTLVSSLRHFLEAKAYALFFFIGMFSGMWPYIKIFCMLMLWFVPASERLRGRALHWIDILGKWSLIDSFFLCLMAVAFGFDTAVNVLGIDIAVKIEVRPGWGVYSFVVATIWSLALSHYLTHVHRRAVERREWTETFLRSMKRPPHESIGTRPFAPFPKRRRFKCHPNGRLVMWFLLLSVFCITLIGQLAPTFEFKFGGLAELILPDGKAVNRYSLVHIGTEIPEAAKDGGYLSGGPFWNWFLTVQFFALAMVIPLCRAVLLMVLWGVPMTLRTARTLHNLAEIVSAWSAIDVFLVSIIAAVMEIGALSQEVISSAFGPIESVICELLTSLPPQLINTILHAVGLGSLDLTNGCALFRVDAVLERGCWLIVAAILLVEISSHIIMELCEASIAERMAMLSAYHKSRGISPRRSSRNVNMSAPSDFSDQEVGGGGGDRTSVVQFTSPASASSAVIEPLLRADNTVPTSRSLRRLLSAQELGSERFVGSWFDFFYGPFPRTMWPYLVSAGLMRRVEWEEIGRDLHEDLVPPSPTAASQQMQQQQQQRRAGFVVSGSSAAAMQQDDAASAGADSWTADSPHVGGGR